MLCWGKQLSPEWSPAVPMLRSHRPRPAPVKRPLFSASQNVSSPHPTPASSRSEPGALLLPWGSTGPASLGVERWPHGARPRIQDAGAGLVLITQTHWPPPWVCVQEGERQAGTWGCAPSSWPSVLQSENVLRGGA